MQFKLQIVIFFIVIQNVCISQSAETFFEKGNDFFDLYDYSNAIEFYTKAIELNNKNPDYFYNRALSYAKTGNPNESLIDINVAISLSVKNPKAEFHFLRATLLEGKNNISAAITEYSLAFVYNHEKKNEIKSKLKEFGTSVPEDWTVKHNGEVTLEICDLNGTPQEIDWLLCTLINPNGVFQMNGETSINIPINSKKCALFFNCTLLSGNRWISSYLSELIVDTNYYWRINGERINPKIVKKTDEGNIDFYIALEQNENTKEKIIDETKSENQNKKIRQKNYEDLGNNLYKIFNNNEVKGYIKLPSNSELFNIFLQDKMKEGEGSGDFLLQEVGKEEFLQNLGKFIDSTKKINKKLIVSIDDGVSHKFLLNNKMKYGMDENTTKFPKVSYQWIPLYNRHWDITGWLEFD